MSIPKREAIPVKAGDTLPVADGATLVEAVLSAAVTEPDEAVENESAASVEDDLEEDFADEDEDEEEEEVEMVTPASLQTEANHWVAVFFASPQLAPIAFATSLAASPLQTPSISWGLSWVLTASIRQAGGEANATCAAITKTANAAESLENIVSVGNGAWERLRSCREGEDGDLYWCNADGLW